MNPTCPTCRRAFTLADTECRRCGTELLQLAQLLQQAAALRQAGSRQLPHDHEAAETLLQQSQAILPDPATRQKLALAALLQGRFAEALQAHAALASPQ